MNSKNILILIIVVIVLVGGYFLIFTDRPANNQNENKPVELPIDFNDAEVIIRDMANVPEEYYSGESRYSHGECQQDDDCDIIGCSLEMCSSDSDLMTTCEILGDVPEKEVYACGCIKDTCGWYEK